MIKVGFSKTDLEEALLPKDWFVREERIEAIAFYVESDDVRALWLVLDFMDFNRLVTDTLKTEVEKRTGVGIDNIHIVTTHNHGGGEPDLNVLAQLVAEGAVQAQAAARPSLMRYVFTNVDKQVNYIRRIYVPEINRKATLFYGASEKTLFNSAPFVERMMNFLKDGKQCYSGGEETNRPFRSLVPGDEELVAVQFCTEQGESVGSIVRFSAHAVCCNRDGSFSSDYPFHIRRRMEEEFGGIAIFMNGPCGDIAPGMIDKNEGIERVLGEYLAETAISALDGIPFEEIGCLKDEKVEIELPVRREILSGECGTESDMPENLTERHKYLDRKSLNGLMGFLKGKYMEGERKLSHMITVFPGFLQVGELVFAGFPGESFSVTGSALQQAFPGVDICTVTEHERTVMYLPPLEDFEFGSYEAVCKVTAPESEEVLKKRMTDALEVFLKG